MTATNEAVNTENPAAVTFDTLAAAQELTAAGLDDRQAEAIVMTVSKAMSETVATKADLELQGAALRADLELQGAALRADLELQGAAIRADIDLLRTEVKGDMKTLRTEVKGDINALRTEVKGDMKTLRTEMKLLEQAMATLQDKIVLKLGALMVTMAFLFLALGPFYFRWVMSLVAS